MLGGWQVQGIVRLGSGFPFTVTSTNVCQCGSFVPQRVNFASGREGDAGKLDNPTSTLWFDPTAYVGAGARNAGHCGPQHCARPGTERVDFSLSKRFPIDKARVEFRWEVFNLLNHANFGTPDSNISNVTAGTITTADEGRNMQFGLRFVW